MTEHLDVPYHHFENSGPHYFENSAPHFENSAPFHHFENSKPPTASSPRLPTSTRKQNQIQLILENILTRLLSVDTSNHNEVLEQ